MADDGMANAVSMRLVGVLYSALLRMAGSEERLLEAWVAIWVTLVTMGCFIWDRGSSGVA